MNKRYNNKKNWPEPKLGVRYRIPDSILDSQNLKNLKHHKEQFNWESYLHIHPDKNNPNQKGYEIYSPIFVELFRPPPVELINLNKTRALLKNASWNEEALHKEADKKATEKLNTYLFFKEYLKGYDEGIKFFNDKFGVSPEIIYGINGLQYERTLHKHFFHTNFENNFGKGWNYWLTGVPIIVSDETFRKYGYYSGIISQVYELKKMHPVMFSKFDLCNLTNKEHSNSGTLIKPESERIFNELSKFKLSDFLESNSFNKEKILKLISEHAGKEIMPFCIALLNEMGFLKIFFNEYASTKTKGNKLLADIFDVNERRIAGNIRILNENSKEDSTQYTSFKHLDSIRIGLKKIKEDG